MPGTDPITEAFEEDCGIREGAILIMKVANTNFHSGWLDPVSKSILSKILDLKWIYIQPVTTRNGLKVVYSIPKLTKLGEAILHAHETGLYDR